MSAELRIVDMCIYIDNHIYNGDYDEKLVYEYLYRIYIRFSKQKKYFINEEDYENYARYSASFMFMRLIDKKQFLPQDNPQRKEKVKSILNFIKTTLYPLRVKYTGMFFDKFLDFSKKNTSLTTQVEYDKLGVLFTDVLNSESAMLNTEITSYMETLKKTIWKIVTDTPYGNDSVMSKKLYLSCIITLLKGMTLSRGRQEKYVKLTKARFISQQLIGSLFKKEMEQEPTCWRLPKEYATFVKILVVRIRNQVIEDITSLIQDFNFSIEENKLYEAKTKTEERDEDE